MIAPGSPLLEPGAYGAVVLSGRVVEHEYGYRAARARAIGLVLVAPRWLAIARLPADVTTLFRDPSAAPGALRRVETARIEGGWDEARWLVVGTLSSLRDAAMAEWQHT
jgi:hypothetical protein